VLEIVIKVGNFMNCGSRNGDTIGFDISSLKTLNDTRALNNQGTLLDFIILQVEKKYPESAEWTKEMEDLRFAKNSSFEKIETSMKELKAQLSVAKQLARGVPLAGSVDLFNEIAGKIAEADLEFGDTTALYESTIKDWEELAKSFAKDPKVIKPEQFFAQIDEFVSLWLKSIETRKRRAEKETKEKKKKSEKAAALRKKQIEQLERMAASKGKGVSRQESEEDMKATAELGSILGNVTRGSSRSLRPGARGSRRGSDERKQKMSGIGETGSPRSDSPMSPRSDEDS